MAFEYIKQSELATTFKDAEKFMSPLFEPFDEFERIARNKPYANIDPSLPKVTDGTLAALIQETPKRIIQQIPTGVVDTNDEWLKIVGTYIVGKEIIPNSNQVAALMQKCWALISKALTYGSQPVYVQFVNRGEWFGTDFTLPYIRDVFLEPGKLSDRDSNVIFLRTWWSKNQIEAVIEKETHLTRSSKDRGDAEQYESGWNLEVLRELISEKPGQKSGNSMTPNERNKQLNNGFYEIVHAFQRGIGANFYSFAPRLESEDKVVRVKVNKDPRGAIPIHFMYANIDLSNPLGRGSVELSGGMQNLLDSEVQAYQYMRTLMMDPPLKVKGAVPTAGLKYAPHALWKLGTDPLADVEPVKLESASLQQFPQNYALMKSQILNLNASADGANISADAGNSEFSKTPAGIRSNEQRLGVSDNYLRKQFEACFEEVQETSLNLYFAERSGIQELTVDDDTAMKLRKLDPGVINEQNVIRIDYDDETPKLSFQVDASSSSVKDNAEQMNAALQLLDITGKYPQLDSKQGGPIDTGELADRIVAASSLEDAEKIIKRPEDGEEQAQPAVTMEQVQQMIMQAMQELGPQEDPIITKLKTLGVNFKDLSGDVQRSLVTELLGHTPVEATPGEQETDRKNAETAAKIAELEHKQTTHQDDIKLRTAETALKLSQASHSADMAGEQQDFAMRQHEDSQANADLDREERKEQAKQAAKQPAGANA